MGITQDAEASGSTVRVPAVKAPGSEGGGLTSRVRRGALWSLASVLFLRLSNIALMAVVARIVAPNEFGVFALAIVVHGVLVSLAELGVAAAVARSDLDPNEIAPTVTTIAIATSLLLAGVMYAFAEDAAAALNSPAAAGPLQVLALSVALIGPFAVPGAQLQRDFRQDRSFIANAVSFVPSSVILLVLAVIGDGALAFAWSKVVGHLVAGIVMCLAVPRLYRPGFDRSQVAPLLAFGIPLALGNLLSQFVYNVDYVVIGRVLGVEAVGLYLLAFNVSAWPTSMLSSMLNSVVLPAFSGVKYAEGDFHRALYRGSRSVALVAAPMAALITALATPLVQTIYGTQWTESGQVLQVLAPYGFLYTLGLFLANVIIAVGSTFRLLLVQVAALALLVPTMLLGVAHLGLVGVAAAHIVVACLVTLPIYLYQIRRSTDCGPLTVSRGIATPTFAAVVAGICAWLAASLITQALPQLLVGGVVGAVVYWVLMARGLMELFPEGLARRLQPLTPMGLWIRMTEPAARGAGNGRGRGGET